MMMTKMIISSVKIGPLIVENTFYVLLIDLQREVQNTCAIRRTMKLNVC